MNISKMKRGSMISPKQEYLHRLGKCLLLFFPVKQVLEILSDYQEYVSAGKEEESMEHMVKQWGTPGHVLRALLEESPEAKRYFYKWLAFWGISMLLSLTVLLFVSQDIFLILIPVFVFGFLHGQGQLIIENHLLIKTDCSKRIFAAYVFLTLIVVLLEARIQYLVKNPDRVSSHIGRIPMGFVIDGEYVFFQFIILLLIVWMIKKAAALSIRYLPDVAYALGVMLFTVNVRNCLHSMNILMTEEVQMEFLFPVIYCGIGLGIAAAFKLYLSLMGRRRLWTHR